jgi:archaetidylinositol phosphate synthase
MTPTLEKTSKTGQGFKAADRAHTSILAAAEKRILIWTAARLPAWVNSDHLTALGFASLLLAGASYWYARLNEWALLLVIPFLALNWFGDSLDGTLARVRNRQRPRYGFYVDHILDALGMSFLMAGMALSGYLSPLVAGIFLIFYLLLSIEIYLATYTIGTFHLSYWKFGPTELRILLVIGNLFALHNPYAIIAGRNFLLFDLGFAVGAVALAAILVQATVKHIVMLYREETLS